MGRLSSPVLALLLLGPLAACSGRIGDATDTPATPTEAPTPTATATATATRTAVPTPVPTPFPTPTAKPDRPGPGGGGGGGLPGGGGGGGGRTPPEDPRTPPDATVPPRTQRPGPGETPFPTPVGTPAPTPLPAGVGETCSDPAKVVPGAYEGTLIGARKDHNPSCAPNGAAGPELVYRLAVGSGQWLRARVIPFTTTFDPVLYVASNCRTMDNTCSGGTDAKGPGLVEDLRVQTSQSGDLQLFLDSREAGGAYRIELSLGSTVLKITDVVLYQARRGGDDDELIEAGETWSADLTIANEGSSTVRAVRVTAMSVDAATQVQPVIPPVDVNITSGGTGDVTVTFVVTDVPVDRTPRIQVALTEGDNLYVDSFLVFREGVVAPTPVPTPAPTPTRAPTPTAAGPTATATAVPTPTYTQTPALPTVAP